MARPTLIVFARAPAVGVGKTRLARDIGRVEAWRVYRGLSEGLLRRLRDPRWRLVVRVAPDRSGWPAGLTREPQGSGGLGPRLERAIRAHSCTSIVVVGADAPEVTPERVARAFRALQRTGAVFGPAEDGGFWLMALSARRARRVRLQGVRWSTVHALADTVAALGGAAPAYLEALSDIDDAPALAAWRVRSRRTVRAPEATASSDGESSPNI
jgi:glycosyltransferase A (GT-A) superfamily protein (DUF2064 family)